jgi:nitroreductase
MDLWTFLNQRQSTPSRLLGEPGPTPEQLMQMLHVAVRVPDHGKLTPWRFVRIAGETRHALGERLAALTAQRDPAAQQATIDKDRKRFAFAPLIVAVIATLTPGHKVPEQEQLLSAGVAAYNLMLAALAQGFGAQWLTGWPAYDAEVGALFALQPTERLVAFVHIGTATEDIPERPRPDPATLLRDLVLSR